MNPHPTAPNSNHVSSEIVIPALRRLGSKTTGYTTLSIIAALAMGAIAAVTPWEAGRARGTYLTFLVAFAILGVAQARKRLQIARLLRLAQAGAQITMDGSELTATHNNVSHMMLLDVKTSYAINFPPADLKLPRATVVE